MRSRMAMAALGLAVSGALCAGAAQARGQGDSDLPAYKDTSLPFDKRVADLVSRMTLEEKAEQAYFNPAANKRLGIPAVNWWTEGIHGISRAGRATVFPQAIGLGATWDPELLHDVAAAIADEARAKFNPNGARYQGIIVWAPTVNMARDPRWGRTEETYGEDPFLTGQLGVAFCRGLQGDDPKYLKTVATPKHFAMHSQETSRMSRSFDCPEAIIRDYYFPAFRDCFVEGKATSTMAAFSGLNKTPDTANFWLLTQVLRKEWGFEGAVVSDWGAVTNLYTQQQDSQGNKFSTSDTGAVTAALNAGLDVISDPRPYAKVIVDAVRGNELKEDILNRAVSRNLMLRFRLGMFDPPAMVPFAHTPASVVGSKEHLALARKAAEESFVLLKNDPAPRGYGFEKLLPLDLRRINSIAVLGPYANQNQYGAYSGDPAGKALTIQKAIAEAVGERVAVRNLSWNDTEYSIRAAAESDVAIVVVGLNSQVEREGIDRASVTLPYDQEAFLEKIVKANPLTILILEGGSSIGLAWAKEHVPAIMMIWYPGEEGGAALARVLLGQANPSGRLPMTFYRANDDLPPLDDYDITKGRTYMYLQKPPSYVFGHGLSYTTFVYRGEKLAATQLAAGDALTVNLEVANTGKMDGEEVVQLYVREKQPAAGVKRPMKQLKAFERVSVPRGQARAVSLAVPVEKLAFWSMKERKYVVEPGAYEVMVGASTEDIRWRGEVAVRGP